MNVNIKEKSFNVTDFSLITDFSESVVAHKTKVEKEKSKSYFNFDFPNNLSPKKIYFVCDNIYLYLSDNHLYQYKNDQLSMLALEEFSVEPKLFSLNLEGKPSLLIISNGTAFVFGERVGRYSIPVCADYIISNNNLIGFKDNEIIFFESFFRFNRGGIEEKGNYKTDENFGKILYITCLNNTLTVFLERTVLTFTLNGNFLDYTIKKEDVNFYNVEKDSIKKINDKIFFISDKKVYYYQNSKINPVNTLLDGKDFQVLSSAVDIFGEYGVKVLIEDGEYLFILNEKTFNGLFLGAENLEFTDGYFIDKVNNKIGGFSVQDDGNFTWRSKKLYLSNYKNAVISGISLSANQDVKIRLKGDFGYAEYDYYKNKKAIRTGLNTGGLEITLFGQSGKVLINALTVYYRTED